MPQLPITFETVGTVKRSPYKSLQLNSLTYMWLKAVFKSFGNLKCAFEDEQDPVECLLTSGDSQLSEQCQVKHRAVMGLKRTAQNESAKTTFNE